MARSVGKGTTTVGVFLTVLSLALLPAALVPVEAALTSHIAPVASPSASSHPALVPRSSGTVAASHPTKFVPHDRHGSLPSTAGIDPYNFYSKEPAPMGIADYGITSPGTGAYTYNTSAVRGEVTLLGNPVVANASLKSSSPYFGLQLNVMMVFDDAGGNQYTYWVQDVALYNTSSDQLAGFIDNIWNDSSPGAQMLSSSVSGNGSVQSSAQGGFYLDVAGPSLPGAVNSPLVAPHSLTLQMDAFLTGSGAAALDFTYQDGFGPVAYDVVSFPWATALNAFYGFVVYGGGVDPIGEPYDLELIIGGPGGGSHTTDVLSDFLFTLWYFNGNNFQIPQNTFNFGSETAEGTDHVQDSAVYLKSDGNLSALLLNATTANSLLAQLYSYTVVAGFYFTDGTANGTLTVNGLPTLFFGGVANMTLYPGSYYVNVTIGGSTTPLGVCKLTAQTELRASLSSPCSGAPPPTLTITSFTASTTSPSVGQTVSLTVVTSGGGGTLRYAYSGLPTGCATANTTSLACVPIAVGTYSVTVWVNSTVGQAVHQSLTLTVVPAPTPPSITSFMVSSTSITVGQTVTLTVVVAGGTSPLTYSYQYLPAGCNSSNVSVLPCTPSAAGSSSITVVVTDSLGKTASDSVALVVTSSGGTTSPGGGGGTGLGTFEGLSEYLWIALVAVIVIVVAVLALLMRKRSRPAAGSPPAEYPGAPPAGQRGAPSNAPPAGAWAAYPPSPAPPAAWSPPSPEPVYSPAPAAFASPPAVPAPIVPPRLAQPPRICARCGAPYLAGALQCARCGAYLPTG